MESIAKRKDEGQHMGINDSIFQIRLQDSYEISLPVGMVLTHGRTGQPVEKKRFRYYQ
jgi:hypothetical protein